MAANSAIEWTDTTWNPLAGCKEISPGCTNCYAAQMAHRLAAMAAADLAAGTNPGRKQHYVGTTMKRGSKTVWTGKVTTIPEALRDPFSWRKPRRVFVNSMSDLFHEDVGFWFVDMVFAVMALNPRHTFQVLTKRPDRMSQYFRQLQEAADDHAPQTATGEFTPLNLLNLRWLHYNRVGGPASGWYPGSSPIPKETPWPLTNVQLGTSTEDEPRAGQRIPYLRDCPAAVRFISAEPLLGPIPDLPLAGINWVIAGCESGHGRRRTEREWIESIADQCAAAGVAFFNKQMEVDGQVCGDIERFPEHLRVREFPLSRQTRRFLADL